VGVCTEVVFDFRLKIAENNALKRANIEKANLADFLEGTLMWIMGKVELPILKSTFNFSDPLHKMSV
jgi:hypothetical protein